MNRVNVLLASDANYLPYLEVALKSLLAHHHHLAVFVLNTGDIPSSWASQLQPYFDKRHSTLTLCYLNKAHLATFNSSGYISQSTYLRYYIEDLFQYSESPYWIYLDCDLVLNGDITQPFRKLNFAQYPLAAVSDPYVHSLPTHPYRHQDYFNAGVLYFNAQLCQNIRTNLIELTNQLKNEIIFGDQDVLNVYFQDKWLPLGKEYNYQLDHILYKKHEITIPNRGGGRAYS